MDGRERPSSIDAAGIVVVDTSITLTSSGNLVDI
jgi:hypothetical protein